MSVQQMDGPFSAQFSLPGLQAPDSQKRRPKLTRVFEARTITLQFKWAIVLPFQSTYLTY